MGRFAEKDILDRSKAFALRIIRLVRALPKDNVEKHLGPQLLRSGTSVGANLHEADMTETVKDFCHKVNIAQKEAGETVYWISLIREAGLLPVKKLVNIEGEAEELQKICRQIINSTRRNLPKEQS